MPAETSQSRFNALNKVSLLAPCDGLADFPVYYQGDEAASLYTAWTLAWHPSLIAQTGRLPSILSAYDLPAADSQTGHLVLVPAPSQTVEVTEWLAELQHTGHVAKVATNREQAAAELKFAFPELSPPEPDLTAELYAFGYAYLQTEQLTGRLADGSMLDASHLEAQVVAMAQAALAGDKEALSQALRAGYDCLEQVRNHTYPTAVWMAEVVLTAESTLGDRLRSAVAENSLPVSLLIERPLLERLAKEDAGLLSELKSAVEARRVSPLLSPSAERELSWLSPGGLRAELTATIEQCLRLLGKRPSVFARFGSLLPPRLPQLLCKLGVTGTLLNGFDGAAPPMTDSVKVDWQGIDGSRLSAIASVPLDLSLPQSYVQLAERIRETLDRDHTATLLLAGWAGCRHPFYEDLRRVAKRSRLLGEWITLEDYFEKTAPPDHPYYTDGWWFGEERPARDAVLASTMQSPSKVSQESAADDYGQLVTGLTQTAKQMLAQTAKPTLGSETDLHQSEVMLNGWSFTRPMSGADEQPPRAVPGLGLAQPSNQPVASGPNRASGRRLINEHMEVLLSETAGGISAVKLHSSTQNRFSQRLVGGIGNRGSASPLEMRAESLEVVSSMPTQGALQATGQLVTTNGVPLLSFQQTVTLDAMANRISVHGELSQLGEQSEPTLWLATRIALPIGHWDCKRGLQWLSVPASGDQFVMSDYAHWQREPMRLTFASPSLACLRRCVGMSQDRMQYDAMIPSLQNGKQHYEFHLAIDERYPMRLALDTAAHATALPMTGELQARSSLPPEAWLMNVDAANVQVASLQMAEDRTVRIELIETEGRNVSARLRACHPWKSAHMIDGDGNHYPLTIEEGAAVIETPAYAWMDVVLAW